MEVYEVDPETGLRVTTRSPTTKSHDLHFSRTTTQLKSIEPVDSDTDYYTYLSKPTSNTSAHTPNMELSMCRVRRSAGAHVTGAFQTKSKQ